MSDDREIARRTLDRQARAKDYPLINIPTYREWSKRKLEAGESEAFIAHLDALSIWLLPEEVPDLPESTFEELLADIKETVENPERR